VDCNIFAPWTAQNWLDCTVAEKLNQRIRN